jgi:hypothetical protein
MLEKSPQTVRQIAEHDLEFVRKLLSSALRQELRG